MRKATPEQQAVLDGTDRVRIVRAAPGSGKTWLVAELIRLELENWAIRGSGIAALSFTRVGGDEIRKAVGHELNHPHFVGTIDAFLLRYVVRPFLKKCFPSHSAPRLIPGEWGAEHWGNYGRGLKAAVGKGINLFGCVFIDEKNGKEVVAHKPHPALPLRPLNAHELRQVMGAKKQMWERSGCLTHSDAAYLASKILGHFTLGTTIRSELTRRFPLIIVDELQDTGYFLGKSIQRLVGDPTVRSVLVGDPDQAIYEFNGARPDLFNLFESIEGAISLQLSNSLRCAPSVATVASHLKDSGGNIGPAHGKTGKTFLVRYGDMFADIPRIVDAVKTANKDACIKVIARHNSTVAALIRRNAKPFPKLGCPSLNHMHRAVVLFRQGRHAPALAAARAAIELVIFQHEGVEDAELEKHGIEPSRCNRLALDCLLRAAGEVAEGILYDWQDRVGQILDSEIIRSALCKQHVSGKLKTKRKKQPTKQDCGADPCADYLPECGPVQQGLSIIPIQTVHGVKGETHDITIFVCPDAKANYCPSTVWWSPDEKVREEKRIAYVAMTRSQGNLIVYVSENCYQRLCASHKPFVESFDYCKTLDEFVA